MNNNIVYEMDTLADGDAFLSSDLFITTIDNEERSKYALNQFVKRKAKIKDIIVFTYDVKFNGNKSCASKLKKIMMSDSVNKISLPLNQIDFVEKLKQCKALQTSKNIVIDISSLLTPYIFLLLKYIYMINNRVDITVINTIPCDYVFTKSPFISHKSYYGDLRMGEIYGFSGINSINQDSDLFIFSGFEGALSAKVEEETSYNNLYIVNTLPSYYQKYKDVSIINNYHLMENKKFKMLYVPAINPFEVYNIIDNTITNDMNVSIAPLCTKPISLGICMYALEHNNIRILYPFSDKYELDRSHGVHKSYYYKINFN